MADDVKTWFKKQKHDASSFFSESTLSEA